jgi:PilZ domain
MSTWIEVATDPVTVEFETTANRRAEPRYAPSAVPSITSVRTFSGDPLTLVNISTTGVLVEGGTRMKPGERVALVLEGLEPNQISGRVVRTVVSAIGGTGTLCFQTGIAFDQRVTLPLPSGCADETPAPVVDTTELPPSETVEPSSATVQRPRVYNRW